MLRPSPNHGTQRLPNDDDDDDISNFSIVLARLHTIYDNAISVVLFFLLKSTASILSITRKVI